MSYPYNNVTGVPSLAHEDPDLDHGSLHDRLPRAANGARVSTVFRPSSGDTR